VAVHRRYKARRSPVRGSLAARCPGDSGARKHIHEGAMERQDHGERSRGGDPARSPRRRTEQCGLTGARMVPRRGWQGSGH
jgi:hypothetical protein